MAGSDLSEVQKYISPDQLPEAYGGTRCEPDPYCSRYVSHPNSLVSVQTSSFSRHHQINPGCDVPAKYYLSNCTETSKEDMVRVVIGRASSHLISHTVDTPGTVIRYVEVRL